MTEKKKEITLTKKQLLRALSAQMGVTEKMCGQFLNCLLQQISNALQKEETVVFKKLGKLRIATTPKRTGRNVKTRETMEIPERKVVRWRSSLLMKKLLNPDIYEKNKKTLKKKITKKSST